MEGKQYILQIAIILISAYLGGYVSKKLRQPAVLGQIVAGVIIGPSVLNIPLADQDLRLVEQLAEIGVIFLMFIAGLETDVKELKDSGKSSMLVASGGVALPLFLGTGVCLLLGMPLMSGVFVGLILTATSVSISVQVLREMDQLRSKQGLVILGAAIIDDVLGIILLSIIAGIVKPGATGNVWVLMAKMGIFFLLSVVLGVVFAKLLIRFVHRINLGEHITVLAVIFCLILAYLAETSGVAAITGAYIAGIILSATQYQARVSQRIQTIAYGVFTPIFFVSIGLKVHLAHLGTSILFSVLVAGAAIIGKVVGCGAGARLSGFRGKECIQIGVGMIARAEVALIVSNLGYTLGVIDQRVLTSVIFLVLISTVVTPPLLKLSFGQHAIKVQSQGQENSIPQ